MNHYFDFSVKFSDTAVSFGRFDGLHTGHRALLKVLASYENPTVISFVDNSKPVIYTETEKACLLGKLGVKNMVSVDAEKYEGFSVADFVRHVLAEKLNAKAVVVGANHEKLGELLVACVENGIKIRIVDTEMFDGKAVSSCLVQSFMENDMNMAIRLMGGSYVMAGPVVHGKALGRKHGMPTANLGFSQNKLWPEQGVYGTSVTIGDRRYRGMTNVGLRPTVDDISVPTCETYILDFNSDIYDNEIVLEAFAYIRPVMKFNSLDEVRTRIERDLKTIEKWETDY